MCWTPAQVKLSQILNQIKSDSSLNLTKLDHIHALATGLQNSSINLEQIWTSTEQNLDFGEDKKGKLIRGRSLPTLGRRSFVALLITIRKSLACENNGLHLPSIHTNNILYDFFFRKPKQYHTHSFAVCTIPPGCWLSGCQEVLIIFAGVRRRTIQMKGEK